MKLAGRVTLLVFALLLEQHAALADAFDVARRMGPGVNILGYDGFWEGRMNAPFRLSYLKRIRSAGFRHVRINLHAFRYMDAAGVIDIAVLGRLDEILRRTIESGLIPVLDEHDFGSCQRDPIDCSRRLEQFWDQLASRYARRFPELVFELLNEPGGNMTPAMWNSALASLLRVIRRTNPTRPVIVPAVNSEDPEDVARLQLPEDDRNLIIAVHYYKPMEFTHQGATWSRKFGHLRGVTWGSDEDRAQLTQDFAAIAARASRLRRPVYLGEFGAYEAAGLQARAEYVEAVARAAREQGWPWAIWQFDHDFAIFDSERERWVAPIITGLFSSIRQESGARD
jgi:endoglucanase